MKSAQTQDPLQPIVNLLFAAAGIAVFLLCLYLMFATAQPFITSFKNAIPSLDNQLISVH